jgi:hypothetical protein
MEETSCPDSDYTDMSKWSKQIRRTWSEDGQIDITKFGYKSNCGTMYHYLYISYVVNNDNINISGVKEVINGSFVDCHIDDVKGADLYTSDTDEFVKNMDFVEISNKFQL